MINHTITLYDHKDKKNINKCEMHAAVYNKYTNKCVEVFGAVEDVRQLYYALKQYFENESK